MKQRFTFIFFISVFISQNYFSQNAWDWVISDNEFVSSTALDIVSDNENNTYTTGYFGNSFYSQSTFGDSTIMTSATTNFFITKSDSSGNVLWTYTDNDTSSSYGRCITTDNALNLYAIGYSEGSGKTFVIKLDSSGQQIWKKEYGTGFSPLVYDPYYNGKTLATYSNRICFASSDSLFVVDDQGSIVSSKPANISAISKIPGIGFLTATGTFISTYDSTLNLIDIDTIGTGNATINSMVCNGNSLYVTGNYTGTFTCGSNSFTEMGSGDVFITKWSADIETYIWSVTEGDSQNDCSFDIDVDSIGNLFICGTYRNITNFGGNSYGDWGQFEEIYIARFDEQTGTYLDIAIAGGTREKEYCFGIDVGINNTLFACGAAIENNWPTYFGIILNQGSGYFITKLKHADIQLQLTGVVLELNTLTNSFLDIFYEKTPLNFIKVYNGHAYGGSFTSPVFYDSGHYLVKAREVVLSNSAATYYGDEYMWYNSTLINIQSDSIWYDTINLIEIQPPSGGTDTIAGTVTDSITGAPYRFVDVMLTTNSNVLLNYTQTDSTGNYSFNNIPHGDYRVYVNYTGYFMASYYTISIVKSSSMSYDFIVGSNLIYALGVPTSNIENHQPDFKIYPNPSSEVFYISGINNNSKSTIIELYDINGKLISSEKLNYSAVNNHKIETTGLNKGLYIVVFKANDQIIQFEKIVVK